MEKYAQKLQELEALFNRVGNGGVYDNKAMEKALSSAEEMVQSMQKRAEALTGKPVSPFLFSLPSSSHGGLCSFMVSLL